MADVIYNAAKKNIMLGNLDFDTHSFKCMLVTSAYTPDQDAHEFRSSVTNEVTGTGYTAGGVALTALAVTQDNTLNRAEWDFADPVWAASTITARAGIVYRVVGTAATDILVAYIDFGSDKSSSAGEFRLTINSEGFLALA